MISGGPISSFPICAQPDHFIEGALEIFIFTVNVIQNPNFVVKLIKA